MPTQIVIKGHSFPATTSKNRQSPRYIMDFQPTVQSHCCRPNGKDGSTNKKHLKDPPSTSLKGWSPILPETIQLPSTARAGQTSAYEHLTNHSPSVYSPMAGTVRIYLMEEGLILQLLGDLIHGKTLIHCKLVWSAPPGGFLS